MNGHNSPMRRKKMLYNGVADSIELRRPEYIDVVSHRTPPHPQYTNRGECKLSRPRTLARRHTDQSALNIPNVRSAYAMSLPHGSSAWSYSRRSDLVRQSDKLAM